MTQGYCVIYDGLENDVIRLWLFYFIETFKKNLEREEKTKDIN
jgi:hypothetical protein